MNFIIVGVNFKTTSLQDREKIFLSPTEKELLLQYYKNDPSIVEAFVVSTCNRTEVYAYILGNQPQGLIEPLLHLKKIVKTDDMCRHFYSYTGQEAIVHAMRVICGLDSLVIGEKQILGQMKEAIEFSKKAGMVGKSLNILSGLLIETGKKARRETEIDYGGSSISWAAVMMAQQKLGTLEGKVVVVLGSGKMGKLALDQLLSKKVKKIFVVSRDVQKVQGLAMDGSVEAVSFWKLNEVLRQADVCMCSSAAPHYIIDSDLIKDAIKARPCQKLLCIDISVPRNINPNVAHVPNVELVEVDDLQGVVAQNQEKRMSAIPYVETIIEDKIKEYHQLLVKRQQYLTGEVYA